MEKTGVNRVNYFPRQVLRTQDFVDEQAYHLEARRRHNIGQHLWGIVDGLELTLDKDGAVFVTPGFAIDGFGRELVLPSARAIPSRAFDDRLTDSLEVWAVYGRAAGDLGDPSYQPCAKPGERINYRWSEVANIEWTRAVEARQVSPELGVPECRQPPDVSPEDLGFDATRVAPDDPSARWPVFLGRIDRTGTGGDATFAIDMGGRPYAGARAEAIVTPGGTGWLQIGHGCDNDFQFALFLNDPQLVPPQLQPMLSLDHQHRWQIRGTTTVRGDLKVDGGAVQFGAGIAANAPQPWRVYRAAAEDQSIDELRIEMQRREGETRNQVAIGVFANGQFKRCLTIADDCTVTVDGDLIVKGAIPNVEKAILSEQGKAIAASVFTSGVMQSLNLAISGGPIPGPKLAFMEAALAADADGTVDAIAELFRQRPELLKRFRETLDAPEAVKAPTQAKPPSGRKRAAPKNAEGDDGTDEG